MQEKERKLIKCDFCPMSGPDGKCFWSAQPLREDDCEKAIKLMVKVLKINQEKEDE